MNRTLRTALAVVALALVSACGGSEAGGAAGNEQAASKVPPGAKRVMMIDIKYMPMELRIPKGTTVAWTNDDQVAHSVTKRKGVGPMFDSGLKAPGTVYTQKFDTKGTIDYYCTIHPNQLGKIIVV